MERYKCGVNIFAGVAYCLTTSTVADLSTIEIVIDWGPEMDSREKIPSVISYSPARNEERQFGADVCDDAVTMMNFKLELEVQDKRLDELELTLQVLEGTNNLSFEHIKKSGGDPEYSHKAPADIVTDYLTKVCESAWQVIEPIYLLSGQRPLVDIVVTVPVVSDNPTLYTSKTNRFFSIEMVVSCHKCNIPSNLGCWFQQRDYSDLE